MAGGRGYRKSGPIRMILATAAVMYILIFMPTPYVVFEPGTAEATRPMVQIEAGDPEEKGVFMMTTVRMTYSNVLSYIGSYFDRHADVFTRKEVFGDNETQEEYTERQEAYMLTSQANAIEAAYKQAAVPYKIRNEGVVILQTISGMPADGVLKPGDRVVQVNGVTIASYDDLTREIGGRAAGDKVAMQVKRGEELISATLLVSPMSTSQPGQNERVGVGITTAELLSVQAEDAGKQVRIEAGQIGGPSAGLMFALEIYNQLTPGDLSKGYRIAGTGTITPDGKVGEIGGIQYKVVASDRKGAEVFFAPAKNYDTARRKAEQIGSDMEVVKVETIGDALAHLAKLTAKPAKADGK
ncbi:YlbL family protein [Paenibacillus turpanensis]|uniref:YlbL family protein n=1 Tax=Paenibacillus turpanensis TaxID=2689078 RepID=UPI00140B38D0|nr:PDZ domain-containing protein [Paenibacillus turpanensis]